MQRTDRLPGRISSAAASRHMYTRPLRCACVRALCVHSEPGRSGCCRRRCCCCCCRCHCRYRYPAPFAKRTVRRIPGARDRHQAPSTNCNQLQQCPADNEHSLPLSLRRLEWASMPRCSANYAPRAGDSDEMPNSMRAETVWQSETGPPTVLRPIPTCERRIPVERRSYLYINNASRPISLSAPNDSAWSAVTTSCDVLGTCRVCLLESCAVYTPQPAPRSLFSHAGLVLKPTKHFTNQIRVKANTENARSGTSRFQLRVNPPEVESRFRLPVSHTQFVSIHLFACTSALSARQCRAMEHRP
jgi:hypothetical protein